MGDGDEEVDYGEQDNREGRYYIGDGLYTHPETGGNFTFSNPADNA